MNYDNINQAGPDTPSIIVNVTMSKKESVVTTKFVAPILPDNPSIIPGVETSFSDCDDYKVGDLPTGGEPHVAIVCIPRLFLPKIEQTMGILAWGGTPPYAVSIDFGYGSEDEGSVMDNDKLLTITSPGYKTVKFSYAVPNTYRIALKLTDNKGVEAIVQTAVQVNGQPETPIGSIANDIFGTPLLETPVPIYLLAVAITLGFWGGDIFDRYFGAKKFGRRNRRTA